MPRKPQGDHPLTVAERQVRHRKRRIEEAARWKDALARALAANTKREADKIILAALNPKEPTP